MIIQQKQKENHGLFFIEEEGDVLAEMVYSMRQPNEMIIEHTEVDEQLRGKNVGFQLVNHAVEYARRHNYKITPVCLFAKSVFDKKPDFADVLAS
ncbi:MAG: GNAT family N-acetyltransferase [Flavisolibacter sp.]